MYGTRTENPFSIITKEHQLLNKKINQNGRFVQMRVDTKEAIGSPDKIKEQK
jgi:hypothetical protein